MELYLKGATLIIVKLEVGAGVTLYNPELWHLVRRPTGFEYVELDGEMDNSSAEWRVSLEGSEAAMQLYYDGLEPRQPRWAYPATIIVTDRNGNLLEPRPGSSNPSVRVRQIGATISHADADLEMINAY